jgi:hypothetical protein
MPLCFVAPSGENACDPWVENEKVQFEHIWAAELPEPDLASELLVGIEYLISWWRKAYVSGGCRWLHENVRMTALLNSSAF